MANNGNVPMPRVVSPRVIVLDIGNVLVGLDWTRPAARLKHLFPHAADPAGAFRKLDALSDRYGMGLIATEEFLARALQVLDLELDRETFISLWNDIFVERPYMLSFLRELREQGH